MEIIKFKIRSLRHLLMDRFIDEGIRQPKTEAEYKKQAEQKVYRDEKGNLAVEARAIKAIIRDAGADISKNKRKLIEEQIRACLYVSPNFLSLNKKKYDGIRKDIVKRTQGKKITRVSTYRPQINHPWEVEGIIEIAGGLTPDFIKEALEYGGLRKGLYGYRPEFGQFEVIEWIVDGKIKK